MFDPRPLFPTRIPTRGFESTRGLYPFRYGIERWPLRFGPWFAKTNGMYARGLSINATAIATQWAIATVYRVTRVTQGYQEVLEIAAGSQQYTVRIEGNAPPSNNAQVVREGDFITIEGRSRPEQGVVRREDIRKMR